MSKKSNRKRSTTAAKTARSRGKGLFIEEISIKSLWTAISYIDDQFKTAVAKLLITCMVCIVIMVQLRVSVANEKNQYMDRLPSYRRFKARAITGEPGRVTAALLVSSNLSRVS